MLSKELLTLVECINLAMHVVPVSGSHLVTTLVQLLKRGKFLSPYLVCSNMLHCGLLVCCEIVIAFGLTVVGAEFSLTLSCLLHLLVL